MDKEKLLFSRCRAQSLAHAEDLRIEDTDESKTFDQKQLVNLILSFDARIITENVDEKNLVYELERLASVYATMSDEKQQVKPAELVVKSTDKTWLLTDGSHAYGYISARVLPHQAVQINGFYLDPLLRGTGFAKDMLNKVDTFTRSRKISEIELEVAHYSLAARKFYAKHGFRTKKLNHENNRDLVVFVMSKFLQLKVERKQMVL